MRWRLHPRLAVGAALAVGLAAGCPSPPGSDSGIPGSDAGGPPPTEHIVLLFSADTLGQLEPCG